MPTPNWFLKANQEALNALPADLNSFVTTPEDFYRTALLPVVVGEKQWTLSAFCEQGGRGWPDNPRTIYAPRVLLWIQYPSGEFRWEEPAPDAYGLSTATQDDFGLCLGPIQRGHLVDNAWGVVADRYRPLVRRVVEQRWLVTAYPVTEEERETARALQSCVAAYYDAVLWPFYRHYGSHFLGWMERAAK